MDALSEFTKDLEGPKVYTQNGLETATIRQSRCPEWMACRYGRVTGSTCGRVMQAARCTDEKKRDGYMTAAASAILDQRAFSTDATKWGNTKEKEAVEAYLADRNENSPATTKYDVDSECGLCVKVDMAGLGYSPDGVVTIQDRSPFPWAPKMGYYEPDCGDHRQHEKHLREMYGSVFEEEVKRRRYKHGRSKKIAKLRMGQTELLLEVKCPYSQRKCPDFGRKGFYLRESENGEDKKYGQSGEYVLDMSKIAARNYFYQVQLGMAILDLDVAHLFVWTPKKHILVEIMRQSVEDEADMLTTLNNFHRDYLIPRIDRQRYKCVVSLDQWERVREDEERRCDERIEERLVADTWARVDGHPHKRARANDDDEDTILV